jgi:hypothetical protein
VYYLTTFFKLLYEFSPTTQVVVWLVLLPLKIYASNQSSGEKWIVKNGAPDINQHDLLL